MEQSPLDPLFMILSPVHTASGERTNIVAVGRTNRCAGSKSLISSILGQWGDSTGLWVKS